MVNPCVPDKEDRARARGRVSSPRPWRRRWLTAGSPLCEFEREGRGRCSQARGRRQGLRPVSCGEAGAERTPWVMVPGFGLIPREEGPPAGVVVSPTSEVVRQRRRQRGASGAACRPRSMMVDGATRLGAPGMSQFRWGEGCWRAAQAPRRKRLSRRV
jgi:hypothetical protein